MADSGPDLAVLVDRTLAGDESAGRELLEALYPLVLRMVRSHRARRTAEEDLTQMVFMKIFSKLGQYSGDVPLTHWVSRVAVNTCLNVIKHEQVRPEVRWADLSEPEEDVVRELACSPDDIIPGHGLAARDLVERLLEALPAKDRLLVSLLHLEGRSVSEVAQTLGWNQTLVKVRAFRARRRMQLHLDALLSEPGRQLRAASPGRGLAPATCT